MSHDSNRQVDPIEREIEVALLAPHPKLKSAAPTRIRSEVITPSLDHGGRTELIVLSVQRLAVRCRRLGREDRVTLRAKRFLGPGARRNRFRAAEQTMDLRRQSLSLR
jgi:hypothetical protein